jgi:hypothetical protein
MMLLERWSARPSIQTLLDNETGVEYDRACGVMDKPGGIFNLAQKKASGSFYLRKSASMIDLMCNLYENLMKIGFSDIL